MKWEVYELELGEQVSCAVCKMQRVSGDDKTYKRGEAYLCPPGFFSSNADYICKFHLEHNEAQIEIVDVSGVK